MVLVWWMSAAGWAQDYAAEAKQRMNLEVDLDEIEGALESPGPIVVDATVPRSALPLTPNSTLERVTVFLDHALVTRAQAPELGAGSHVVRFEGLPLAIRPDGIDASIVSGQGRVVAVELVSGQGDVETTQTIDDVRERAKRLTRELGEVQDQIEGLLAQRAYLRRAVLPSQASAQPRLSDLRDMMTYVGNAEANLANALRAEEDAAKRHSDELAPLLVRLADPVATGRTVRVTVEAAGAGPLGVALRYPVSGAGWSASYDARLEGEQVVLEQYGVVSQSTGEDWTDAAIELSTAAVSMAGERPPLVPWVIGAGGQGFGEQVSTGSGVFTEAGIDVSAPVETGLIASDLQAEVRGNGALIFGIEGRRTVAGDGSPQRLPVATQRLATRTSLSTVPRQALEVHRLVTMGYNGEFPLLPGPVATFVEADYVGRGAIPSVVPGESLTLSFGPNDGFRVSRQLVTRSREKAGGSKVRYTLRFRLTVSNYTDRAARVEIVDQVPISQEGRINVKVLETSAGALDEPTGRIGWTPTVAPGGDHTVQVAFSITGPQDLARGLEREVLYMY